MALRVVLEDFADGRLNLPAGAIVDEAHLDLTALRLSGMVDAPYVAGAGGTDEAVAGFNAQKRRWSEGRSGDMIGRALLSRGGASMIGTLSGLSVEASLGSASWVGLTDTPGAIAPLLFNRGNALGTAIEQFDLFGTANAWTATQTFHDIAVAAANTYDIGTVGTRFRRIHSNRLINVRGSGTIAQPADATHGGIMAGTFFDAGGSETMRLDGGTYPATAVIGGVAADPGCTAVIEATQGGAVCLGSAFGSNIAGNATVRSSGYASFAFGYAYGFSTSVLQATAPAAVVMGYAFARRGPATIEATAPAAICFGMARAHSNGTSAYQRSTGVGAFAAGYSRCNIAGYSSLLHAGGSGAFAQGYVLSSTGNSSLHALGGGSFAQGYAKNGTIYSSARGSFAQGVANGSSINATAYGATAIGRAYGNPITASGLGSFASGDSASGTIVASATNAFQWGVGTNAQADSLQVGSAGIRLKGTTGAPGTPQNGDHWIASGFQYIRSDNVNWKLDQSPAWTPTNVSTDRAFDADATSIDELADALGTLIADLKTIGLLG